MPVSRELHEPIDQAARELAECLKALRTVGIPSDLSSLLWKEARYLPRGSLGDFVALVILECCEAASCTETVSAHDVRRIIWRVRKRLARDIRRHLQGVGAVETMDDLPHRSVAPERPVIDQEAIAHAVSRLTAEEAVLLEMLIEGTSQRQIALELGWSESTVSRRLARIRATFRKCLA